MKTWSGVAVVSDTVSTTLQPSATHRRAVGILIAISSALWPIATPTPRAPLRLPVSSGNTRGLLCAFYGRNRTVTPLPARAEHSRCPSDCEADGDEPSCSRVRRSWSALIGDSHKERPTKSAWHREHVCTIRVAERRARWPQTPNGSGSTTVAAHARSGNCLT
jgi:hypothetical protein